MCNPLSLPLPASPPLCPSVPLSLPHRVPRFPFVSPPGPSSLPPPPPTLRKSPPALLLFLLCSPSPLLGTPPLVPPSLLPPPTPSNLPGQPIPHRSPCSIPPRRATSVLVDKITAEARHTPADIELGGPPAPPFRPPQPHNLLSSRPSSQHGSLRRSSLLRCRRHDNCHRDRHWWCEHACSGRSSDAFCSAHDGLITRSTPHHPPPPPLPFSPPLPRALPHPQPEFYSPTLSRAPETNPPPTDKLTLPLVTFTLPPPPSPPNDSLSPPPPLLTPPTTLYRPDLHLSPGPPRGTALPLTRAHAPTPTLPLSAPPALIPSSPASA